MKIIKTELRDAHLTRHVLPAEEFSLGASTQINALCILLPSWTETKLSELNLQSLG